MTTLAPPRPLTRHQWAVLSALRAAGLGGLTTLELVQRSGNQVNATRRARELRSLGYDIQQHYERTNKATGSKVVRWRLVSEP